MKEIIGEFTIQAVFPIHPVGMVVVHPVNYYIIDLSSKSLRKAFRTSSPPKFGLWGAEAILDG